MKKIFSIIISISLLSIILSGCTNTSKNDQSKNSKNDYKNYVYKTEKILDNLKYDSTFTPLDDGFYSYDLEYEDIQDENITFEESQDYWDNLEANFTLTVYDNNFSKTQETSFTGKLNDFSQLSFVDDNKNLYFIANEYSGDTFASFLIKTNTSGNIIYKNKIEFDDEDTFVRNIFENKNNFYIVDGTSSVYKLDLENGKLLENIYKENDYNYIEFISIKDNIYAIKNDFEKGIELGILDENTKEIKSFTIENAVSDMYDFQKGFGNNILARTSDELYKINLDTKKCEKIIDFIQSDINSSDIQQILEVENNFYIALFDEEDKTLFKCTKIDPKNVKDKQIVTVGCVYLPYQIRKEIIKFNMENEDIRITVKDYGSSMVAFDGENSTYGIEALNKDIISGKVPDILILSDFNQMNNYAKKGLFEDYNKLLDKSALHLEDFSDSIVKLFSTNNKTFILPTSYAIKTSVMKKDIYDLLNPYTVETVNKYIKENNLTESAFLGFILRDFAINSVINTSGDKFINLKDGTCNLNNDEFKQLLLFIKNLPLSEDIYTEDFEYEDESSFYRDNKYIISDTYLSTLNDYMSLKYGKFGTDIEIVGMPSCEKIISVSPDLLVGVVKNDKSQQSLKFIEFIFGEKRQNSSDIYAFPVNKKALEEKIKKEKNGPFTIEDGKEVYYDDFYYINDAKIQIPKPNDKDIKDFEEILENVNYIDIQDDKLLVIISEELDAFYSGQKSVDEIANILQSRVSIYLSERK